MERNLTRRKRALGLHPSPNRRGADTRLRSATSCLAFTYTRLPGDSALFLPLSPTLAAYRPSTRRSRHYDLSAQRKKRSRGYRLRCSTAGLAGWLAGRARGAVRRPIPRNDGNDVRDRSRINLAQRRTAVPRCRACDLSLPLPFRRCSSANRSGDTSVRDAKRDAASTLRMSDSRRRNDHDPSPVPRKRANNWDRQFRDSDTRTVHLARGGTTRRMFTRRINVEAMRLLPFATPRSE